ncbi:hypothetical protein BDR26DRAFT_903740 [Obelidium mucronatum]|nr:hypothetical protein BDR26DRAFT_903740 [Obelidium mucronatum]
MTARGLLVLMTCQAGALAAAISAAAEAPCPLSPGVHIFSSESSLSKRAQMTNATYRRTGRKSFIISLNQIEDQYKEPQGRDHDAESAYEKHQRIATPELPLQSVSVVRPKTSESQRSNCPSVWDCFNPNEEHQKALITKGHVKECLQCKKMSAVNKDITFNHFPQQCRQKSRRGNGPSVSLRYFGSSVEEIYLVTENDNQQKEESEMGDKEVGIRTYVAFAI